MSESKRHWRAFGMIGVCSLAVIAGQMVRSGSAMNHTDIWRPAPGLVASAGAETDVPAMELYAQMSELISADFVDEVKDPKKLLAGAVRGMVSSLRDQRSFFMSQDVWQVFEASRAGSYQGIGADLVLEPIGIEKEGIGAWAANMPRLVIGYVTPNGPAAKAGLRAGDAIEMIDDHWVVNGQILAKFVAVQRAVKAGKAKQEDLTAVREEYRKRSKHSISPMKAFERLTVGESGDLDLVVERGTNQVKVKVSKAKSTVEPIAVSQKGVIALQVRKGAADALSAALPKSGNVVIDLRGNVFGDSSELASLLNALAPKGTYGTLVKESDPKGRPLQSNGSGLGRALTLIVDSTTRDAAQVLARALSTKGVAKLEGGEMREDAFIIGRFPVNGAGGYTLTTEAFKPEAMK